MDGEIRLLEARVRRAVERLGELAADNARLSAENGRLKSELDRATKEAKRPRATERRDPAIAAWADSLREAIRELRND